MTPRKASATAVDTAHIRALDYELLSPPMVGDDLAGQLLKPEEREERETDAIETVLRQTPDVKGLSRAALLMTAIERNSNVTSLVLSRARYAEEKVLDAAQRGISQYVIIGAGLDTFAFRHRDLLRTVTVLEIDHPQSQSDKLSRLRAAGLDEPDGLHFAACDLALEDLSDALARLPYDPSRPAFFSWLGVTMYLSAGPFSATLRSLHACSSPGSEVVFDYLEAGAMTANAGTESLRTNVERVSRLGEPVVGALRAESLVEVVGKPGFELVEDLGPKEQEAAFFSARRDRLHASAVGHIARIRR